MKLSQKLRQAIQTGLNEADDELSPYMAEEVKHLLHVKDRVIYRGKRLIVPDSLQQRVIELGHEGHQGTSETKSFIRQFCWYPGLDAKVERDIKGCLACRATQLSRHHEPVKAWELPKGPWQFVGGGFPGAISQWGIYIFVMIDRRSHWPEIAFQASTNAKTTINVMQPIFTNKGIPVVLQSENGQPFRSTEPRSSHSRRIKDSF